MQQTLEDDKLRLLQAGLAKVKERFVGSLPEKVAEFDGLLDQLYEEGDVESIVAEIGRQAHKLHGQAGSFGFAPIGTLAAKVEHEVMAIMEGPRPLNFEGVEAYLVALLDQIEVSLKAA